MLAPRLRPHLALAAAALAVSTAAAQAAAQAAGAQAQPRAAGPITQTRDFGVYEAGKTDAGKTDAGKTGAAACAPVAVISRGLGVGQAPMRSLAQALSNEGWRVIVMRHPEAGRSVFSGRLVRSGRLTPKTGDEADPASLKRRAEAIDGALDLARKPCDPPFKALIGHAIGSTTALIEAGAKPRVAIPARDRFNAYVAISPSGPGGAFSKGSWAGVSKPVLVVTGTRDLRIRGGWRPRVAAYEDMPAGGKRLAVVQGATHLALGGLGAPSVRQKVAKSIVDFLGDARMGEMKADPIPGVEFKEK
jgi:alpha-beta hydrolase superfamily lysophospholipase